MNGRDRKKHAQLSRRITAARARYRSLEKRAGLIEEKRAGLEEKAGRLFDLLMSEKGKRAGSKRRLSLARQFKSAKDRAQKLHTLEDKIYAQLKESEDRIANLESEMRKVRKKNPTASDSAKWEKLWANYIKALAVLDKPLKGANARLAQARLGKAEKAIRDFDPDAYKKYVLGRRNPGRKHLAGATAKQQRQYESILKSIKKSGRYKGREKEVAARTVRARQNPDLSREDRKRLPAKQQNEVSNHVGRGKLRGDDVRVHLNADKTVSIFYNGKEHFKVSRAGKTTIVNSRKRKASTKTTLRKAGRAAKRVARATLDAGSKLLKAGAKALNPKKRRRTPNYSTMVAKGKARKTKDGWTVGKRHFSGHSGHAQISPHVWLDKTSGTVYGKKQLNPKRNAYEKSGTFEISAYNKQTKRRETWRRPGESAREALKRQKEDTLYRSRYYGEPNIYKNWKVVKVSNPRKRNLDHRDSSHQVKVHQHWRAGGLSQWQRAHHAGQRPLFEHGIKVKPKRNPSIKKGDKIRDVYGKVHDVLRVSGNVITTTSGAHIHKTKAFKVKKSKRRNPSPKAIRRNFAGRYNGDEKLIFPDGTPHGLAKLGKLISIDTDEGRVEPVKGVAWLCADTRGKLHIGTPTQGHVVFGGPAHDFGKIREIEYSEKKPHLGYTKQTIFFHKMGEETGQKPTLRTDGKGGARIVGGAYEIRREGIVN